MRSVSASKTKLSRKHTKKVVQKSEQYERLYGRPQTVLGIIVIFAVVGLTAISGKQFFGQYALPTPTPLETAPPTSILSGIVKDNSAIPDATAPAQLASSAAKPALVAAQVTPSTLKVKTKKDQTFWEFAKRYCGSHTFAERLATDNGYAKVSDLKEGDWVTISCK